MSDRFHKARVIPAKGWIQVCRQMTMDSRFRGNDDLKNPAAQHVRNIQNKVTTHMNTTRLFSLCALALLPGVVLAAPIERTTVPLYDAQTLAKACTDALADAEGIVNALQAVTMKHVAATDILGRWDRVRIATQDIEGPADLFANVSPDEKTRAAAEDCEQKIERFDTA